MKHFLTIPLVVALALCSPLYAQVIPLADVQGQTDVSPCENQSVTVSGKVTEAFGDTWYLQDDYGASHQNGDAYVLHVGDIDVVSLGVVEQAVLPWSVYPSPVTDA